ncbi:MAG: hypothetical protein GY847_11585 [Proteobacteria bacterium]|nr:hypothetical protein [Pseudomonadota bacterium]
MGDNSKSDIFKSNECRDVHELLEEKLVDRSAPLGGGQNRLAAHIEQCDDCSSFLKIVQNIPALAPTMPHNESRKVLSAARNTYFERRLRMRRFVVFTSAIAAAVLLALLLYPMSSYKTKTKIENATYAPIRSGEINYALGKTVTLFLSEDSIAETVLLTENSMRVRLDSGLLCVNVDPKRLSQAHFSVVTPSGVVQVRGTAFSVEVVEEDVRLNVVRGIVEAFPVSDVKNEPVLVKSGLTFDFLSQTTKQLRQKETDRILSMLGMKPEREKGKQIAETEIENEVMKTTEAVDTEIRSSKQARRKKEGAFPIESSDSETEARAVSFSLQDFLNAARKCRIEKDWNCAVDNYYKVVTGFPGRPEASTALVTIAQIQLRNLNQPQKALNNFRLYRKQKPSGPLASEALYGISKALSKIGNNDEEIRVLEQFLKQHPSNPLAGTARERLDDLRKQAE